ncbi:MAG TPA: hypothetical protein HPP87_04735 [Planctomycetes bacterium]|nr:hypothetical protein [Planctomycetota bacterium]
MVLAAPLVERLRVIKVALEDSMGTKVAGTQAILAENLTIDDNSEVIERKGPGKFLGYAEPSVFGPGLGVCSFSTELRCSGSAGMEAGLAILLQACKFAKSSEVYTVNSNHASDKAISIDAWEDGIKKGLAGAVSNITIHGETGNRILCDFEFNGIWQTPSDEAVPAFTPSATLPLMLKGATFTLDTEAIKIASFSLNMNSNVISRLDAAADSGIAYAMITDFAPILTLQVEADKVAGYDYFAKKSASTEVVVQLVADDGTDKVTIDIPKYQYRVLKSGERDGIAVYDLEGQCNNSSGTADDAVKLTAAAVV